MKVPLVAIFVPQVLISLILGVVSILIFNEMHDTAITESMRNSLSGSMDFVEERIAGPFNELRGNARLLVESLKRNGAVAYLGDESPIFLPDPNVSSVDALRVAYQDIRAVMADSNGTYAFIYQQYRVGRKNGTNASSTDPADFYYGWSGASNTYVWHYTTNIEQKIWSEGFNYPQWETSDIYDWEEDTEGTSFVNEGRYLNQQNASEGRYITLNAYADREIDGNYTLFAIFTYGLPITYDPTTGFAANTLMVDIDVGKWMVQFVADMNIPATQITVVQPSTSQILASSFPALQPGYYRANVSDVSTYVLWTPSTIPEQRLKSAFSAFTARGSLSALPHATTILEPGDSEDIYSAHPIRKAGLELVAIGVTERSHFYSQGERASRDAIIICAFLVLAACLVAIMTAVLLARPLKDLDERMAKTASLEDDGADISPSIVKELATMQRSYTTMKDELRRMKSFLPQGVMDYVLNVDDDDGAQSITDSIAPSDISNPFSSVQLGSSVGSEMLLPLAQQGVALSRLRQVTNALMARDTVVCVVSLAFNVDLIAREAVLLLDDAFLAIFGAATKHRGVVETVKPSQVVITFGARSPISNPVSQAVKMAMAVQHSLDSNPLIEASMVIDSVSALIGVCGSEVLRQEVVHSPDIDALMSVGAVLHSRHRVSVAVTSRVQAAIPSSCTAVPIDCVEFEHGTSVVLYVVCRAPGGRRMIETSEGKALRLAFAEMRKGNYTQAIAGLSTIVGQEPPMEVETISNISGSSSESSPVPGWRDAPPMSNSMAHYKEVVKSAAVCLLDGARWAQINGREQKTERKGSTAGAAEEFIENDAYAMRFIGWEGIGPLGLFQPLYDSSRAPAFEGPAHEQLRHLGNIKSEKEAAMSFTDADDGGGGLFEMTVPETYDIGSRHDGAESEEEEDGRDRRTLCPGWKRSNDVLGTGAFGTVYRGLNNVGALSAIKVMPLSSRNATIDDLQRELTVTSEQRHENLVGYLDAAVSDTQMVVVMELLAGGSLDTLLKDFWPLPFRGLRRFTFDMLSGLAYLHRSGIVHCDVKPQNVLVSVDGKCKLADFGSALHPRLSNGGGFEEDMKVPGTPAYMAPEVARGDVPTTASDIWSLGVVVHELATKMLPYNAQQRELMRKRGANETVRMLCRLDPHCEEPGALPAPPVPSLDPVCWKGEEIPVNDMELQALEGFIAKCLAMDPSQRPSAEALASDAFLL